MTLIAAFRCQEGVVLCADQQETVGGGIRVAVNKIVPQECEHYQFAVAGAGQHGDLIDGFTEALRLDIERWRPQLDEDVARGNIRNLLLDFHENEIEHFPADTADEKRNHFLVCIKPKDSPEIFLWELHGSVIMPVGDYTLIGMDEAIYKHEIKRLYRGKPRGLQAVLLGIHLFSLAKETSNYVGGQTDVIFVRDSGMIPESAEDVRELERRVATFNDRIAELILLCPDTSNHPVELRGYLLNFVEEMMSLREFFTKQAAASVFRHIDDPNYKGDPYSKIPPDVWITKGDSDDDITIHSPEESRQIMESMRRGWGDNPPPNLGKQEGQQEMAKSFAKKKRSQPSKRSKSKGQQ